MMLLFKANVVTDFLQIGIGEFFVKCKRFQTMKVAFLLPVFYKGLCLVEVDVRMSFEPFDTGSVDIQPSGIAGCHVKPGAEFFYIEMYLLQLCYIIKSS